MASSGSNPSFESAAAAATANQTTLDLMLVVKALQMGASADAGARNEAAAFLSRAEGSQCGAFLRSLLLIASERRGALPTEVRLLASLSSRHVVKRSWHTRISAPERQELLKVIGV